MASHPSRTTGSPLTISSRPWEPGDAQSRFRIPLHPWDRGLASDRLGVRGPRTYAKGNCDASWPGLLLPPPKLNSVTLTNAVLPSMERNFDGVKFFVSGRYMYYINPVTNAAVEDKDFGAGKAAVCLEPFNSQLVVGMGESEKIWTRSIGINTSGTANAAVTSTDTTLADTRLALTVNAYIGATVTCNAKTMVVTSNTATTFTGASWSGGGNPGNGNAWSVAGTWTQASNATYAIALGVVDNKLWRAETTNRLSNATVSPLTLTNWLPASPNQYYAGDSSFAVSTITDYGGIPYVGKGDGMYAPDPQGRFKNQTPQLRNAPHVDNCFPAETLIGLNETAEAIFRRWFEGNLVEITTSAGHKLAGTPNHPVLTDRGWIPLGLLKEGDGVISRQNTQWMSGSHPDVEHAQSQIGEIFDAVLARRRAQGKPGVAMDFHGDGQDANVDVIHIDRVLWHGIKSALSQPFKKDLFPGTSLVATQVSPPSTSGQLGEPGPSTTPYRTGTGGDPGTLLWRSPSHTETGGLPLASGADARIPQPPINQCLVDPQHGRHGAGTEAGLVGLDNVVSINRVPFSGYVYNLETSSHQYTANGIVVHNCKGAFVAHASLWVPSSSGLIQIKPGKSIKRGPETTFRPSFRFWVRGGVEFGDAIYLLCTDESASSNTCIIKAVPDQDSPGRYLYHEWAQLDGTTKGYVIGVSTAGTNPELFVGYGNDIRYIKLGRGGGRDVDDANYDYGTAWSLETGRMLPGPDMGVVTQLVGVDVVLDYSRANESLTLSYAMDRIKDSDAYTGDLLTTQEGGGTAAITGTTNYQKVTRYAPAGTKGQFLEVKFAGTLGASAGLTRPSVIEAWAHGYVHPVNTDVLTITLVADSQVSVNGMRTGMAKAEQVRLWRDWHNRGVVLAMKVEDYEEGRTTRFAVAGVEETAVLAEPGQNTYGSDTSAHLKVTLVRVDYAGAYATA